MKDSIGIDEVGRGPLAGPVTLCAVYVEDVNIIKKELFDNTIRDSKKISKSLRNKIYLIIRKKRKLKTRVLYALSSRTAAYIDTYGINTAINACLVSCIESLSKQGVAVEKVKIRLDAGLKVPLQSLQQESFIKGDEKYAEIALASILAKESRDVYMKGLAKTHTEYAWDKNAGYGTLEHRNAIQKYGITKYHRTSYLKAFKLFDKTE